jgi:hypothetical protein
MSQRPVRSTRAATSPPRLRGWGWAAGTGALLAFALIVVAIYLPFAGVPCHAFGCPPVPTGARLSGDLVAGLDGWRVFLLAVAGVACCCGYLLPGAQRWQAAFGALVLALVTAILVGIDAANPASRVLDWTGQGPGTLTHGAGFPLVLVGAAGAVVLSALTVASLRRTRA